jgi:multisubunit Na+/H+ antiporter MnhF subunit
MVVSTLMLLSYLLMGIALLCCLYRFYLGPTHLDRALVAEVATLIVISIIVMVAIEHNRMTLLDLGLVFSLIPFIGAAAVARIIGKRKL